MTIGRDIKADTPISFQTCPRMSRQLLLQRADGKLNARAGNIKMTRSDATITAMR